MSDREQTRRERLARIQRVLACAHPVTAEEHEALERVDVDLDGLLADLEQAERIAAENIENYLTELDRACKAEERLAKVPTLVEALRKVADAEEPNWEGVNYAEADDYLADTIRHLEGIATAALAAWEDEA